MTTQTLILAFICCLVSIDADRIKKIVREFMKNREYQLAIPLIDELLRLDQGDVQSISDRSWIYHMQGNDEAAARLADKALSINPESAPISYTSAVLLSKQGKLKEALERIDIAIRTDPDYLTYKEFKALVLLRMNKTGEAQALLGKLGGKKSGDIILLESFALESAGDFEHAKQLLQKEVESGAAGLTIRFNLARMIGIGAESSESERKLAVQLLGETAREVTKLRSEFVPESIFNFVAACVYATAGEFEAAAIYGRTAVDRYETRCNISLEDLQKALKNFEEKKRYIPTLGPYPIQK